MLRRMVAGVVIAALFIAAAPFSVFVQTSSNQIGTGDELDCGNFLANSRGVLKPAVPAGRSAIGHSGCEIARASHAVASVAPA